MRWSPGMCASRGFLAVTFLSVLLGLMATTMFPFSRKISEPGRKTTSSAPPRPRRTSYCTTMEESTFGRMGPNSSSMKFRRSLLPPMVS
eukprot:649865-Prorocentrum_minimum.AAC.1